jgi:hypothetical protein
MFKNTRLASLGQNILCVKSSSRPKPCDLLELRVIWTNLRVGLTPQKPTDTDPAYRAGCFHLGRFGKDKFNVFMEDLQVMVWRSAAWLISSPRQAC